MLILVTMFSVSEGFMHTRMRRRWKLLLRDHHVLEVRSAQDDIGAPALASLGCPLQCHAYLSHVVVNLGELVGLHDAHTSQP